MVSDFLLYGSTGFVGDAIARLAVKNGLQPMLAGRNSEKVGTLASELGLEYRVFNLEDNKAIDSALKDAAAVLHCAGPYIHTFKPMLDGCLRTGRHYLDITGEIPVLETIAAHGPEAKARGVMLMPGVGFDVVPTDCLAAHLKQRLPSATQLTLAFHSQGPAGLPPGTLKTSVEMIPYGTKARRRNGRLESVPGRRKTQMIDFGQGPVEANMLSWGDVITAFYSTGIPNIEVYAAFPKEMVLQMTIVDYLHPLFRLSAVRSFAKRGMKGGSTAEERARTRVSVWGEVQDDQERKAVSRLHGPEAGVVWTANAALAVVQKVLANDIKPGFQTPSSVYGPDFVLGGEGVTREDLP